MEDLLVLARHAATPLALALASTLLVRGFWLALATKAGSPALSMLLCFTLGLIAGIPNGLHWALDIRHVNLQVAEQLSHALLFATDLLATLFGAAAGWMAGGIFNKRWSPRRL